MSPSQNSPDYAPVPNGLLPPQRVRWGIPDAAGILVVGAAVILGVRLLAAAPWFPRGDLVGVLLSTLSYLVLGALVVLIARRRGLGGLRRDFGFELHAVDLAIGIGMVVALYLFEAAVSWFVLDVLRLPRVSGSNVSLPANRGLAVVYALAIVSFLAPIVEELIFRGLVLRAIRNVVIRRSRGTDAARARIGTAVSVVLSALLFAGGHLYEATSPTMLVELGITIFGLGLALAALATRTGRLGPGMVTHMLFNGVAAVLLLTGR